MKLLSLAVGHFRCVRKAKIEFGVGLNVLYGPNDLGKSSLAYAIRAALLLQASSKEHEDFLNWYGSGDPHVELVFESEAQRIWRVRKTFGVNAQAFLDESRNGVDFHVEARGRDVDGRLSEILRWGLAPPGGKGRPKGMPMTFLSTALLAEQDRVSAVFEQALANDSDESGKKRLVEALQAMAEDPLFKAVLGRVQDRVDEAFTAKGKRRLGKNSPWTQIRDFIRRAEEYERQCDQESQKTAALEIDLQQLRGNHLQCKEAVDRAQELLDEMERSYQKGKLRQEIVERLGQSKSRLTEIRKIMEELASVERQCNDCVKKIGQLGDQERSAKGALTEANRKVQVASEEVGRLQSEDRARERLLKRSSLEKRRAELRTEQVQIKASLDSIHILEAATENVRTLEADLQELIETADGIRKRHDCALETIRREEEQERALRNVGHFLHCRVAYTATKQAESGLAQISAWRNEAERQRLAAADLQNVQPKISLPSPVQLADITQLHQELEIARARLSVGLSVTIQPKRALRVLVHRDDSDQTEHKLVDSTFEASASREIQLNVEGIADIAVSGGAQDAREKFETIQARWIAEVEPVLKRAEAANFEAFAHIARDAAQRSEAIQELQRVATQLEQRAADQPDWAGLLAVRQREAAAAELLLEARDRTEAERLMCEFGITDVAEVDHRLNLHQAKHSNIVLAEKTLNDNLVATNARIADKQGALADARGELVRAQSCIEGDWRTLLQVELGRQDSVDGELKTIESEIQDLTAGQDKPVSTALEGLEVARKTAGIREDEYRTLEDQLRGAERQQASIEGELKARREAAAKLDEAAAHDIVKQIEAELKEAAAPVNEMTDVMLTEARERVQVARDELKRIEDDIQAKRGALQHVGGEVAKQRAEAASDALERAREQEHEMEVDFAAWELLRDTLLEAEQEEGAHLGRALGDPITKRFRELTNSRYGEIALGPSLETHGISAGGSDRPMSALSVGTRDQLSTIFRLSLAEQLKSTVLLDDQLTQSDPKRMVWLCRLIRQVATKIQVLVFTCRPQDYLFPNDAEAESESVNGNERVKKIDLVQVIESGRAARSGGT
jgi:hypothetical protein